MERLTIWRLLVTSSGESSNGNSNTLWRVALLVGTIWFLANEHECFALAAFIAAL